MNTEPDLEYDVASLAGIGSVDYEEVDAFFRDRRRSIEGYYRNFHFDDSWKVHMSRFHGGVPGKRCFRTRRGIVRLIIRFLHFDYRDSDLAMYNVEHCWSQLYDRLGQRLLPFAELFAGDMLCFDFSTPGRPSIVVWLHEESFEGEAPVTDFVAHDFDEFLQMLQAPEKN